MKELEASQQGEPWPRVFLDPIIVLWEFNSGSLMVELEVCIAPLPTLHTSQSHESA